VADQILPRTTRELYNPRGKQSQNEDSELNGRFVQRKGMHVDPETA